MFLFKRGHTTKATAPTPQDALYNCVFLEAECRSDILDVNTNLFRAQGIITLNEKLSNYSQKGKTTIVVEDTSGHIRTLPPRN